MTLRGKIDKREAYWSSLFLAPALLIILICVVLPAVLAFALSWTHASRFGTVHFAGFYNYRKLFADPVALQSFFNTLLYVVFFVPLNIALALAVALLLQPNFRGMKLIRSIYFVPAVLSSMVAVSIFRFLYDARHGPISALLATLGFAPIAWLAQTGYAMAAIIALSLWKSVAFNAIIFLAALQSVPAELHEAATIDGAGAVRRLFNVTVPALRPMIGALTILSLIGAFRVFEPMFVLTEGGPANSTRSIALHAYLVGFRDGELGYSSAVSFVLLVIILTATVLLHRMGGEES
jgi:multiple sugar transport system permease protein